ncbi:MAG: type 1 glutamine amidotransferase domain-containing protein [Janthinobacterium lividum]
MSTNLEGLQVAILATDGVEQVELVEPMKALKAAGADVKIVSLKTGTIQAMHQDVNPGDKIPVDHDLTVDAAIFDALVLPGGTTNPDKLRVSDDAIEFVQHFVDNDKPIAAICHGPWMLIEADAVDGVQLTSWPSLRTDIENAGGEWVDEDCVRDGLLVTSRKPDDLPEFCRQMIEMFGEDAEEEGA